MKKVLSLVLAFAMILGSFGFVFASDFSDVKDTEYYSEPVNVLSGLGVIAGFPDGTFKPGDNVTRAQMATMITAALGIPVKGSGATGFSDVPASHWASGYIAYAVSVGFVAGYPDKTFKPENPVSYNEALTMIVASLGYTAETLPGAWPGAFVNKARGLGILDICSTTGNAAAPRADIACFLYKALTAEIGYVNKDGTWVANQGKDGEDDTMLNRLGANVRKDPVTKKELFFVIEGTEDSLINLKNYMGVYASVYENSDKDIVAIKEVKSEFIEGTLDDLKDDYKFDSAKQMDDVYKSFQNGDVDKKAVDYDADSVKKESLKLAVKLNGKKVSEIYSMQVWKDGKTFMFEADMADEFEAKKPNIEGHYFALDDDDAIDTDEFAMNGVSALSEIKEDDVVTVYEGSDKTVARIDVSSKTINGVISKIKDGKYTIAGTAYALNDDIATEDADKLPGMMNDETKATFYLDYADKIFTFEAEDDTTDNYAIVLKTDSDKALLEGKTAYARLLLADGTTKDFAAKDFENEKKDVVVADGDWSKKPDNGTLVKYTVNSKDKIVDLVIADKSYDETDKVEFDKNGVFKNESLKSSTIVFSYTGTKEEHKSDADYYKVIKAEDLYEAKVETINYIVKSGSYEAALVTGATTVDKEFAIFVDTDGTTKDGTVWTALYDGAVASLTLDKTANDKVGSESAKYTTAAGAEFKLAELTMSDDVVTDISVEKKTADKAEGVKTSVSGSVLTAGSGDTAKKYSLADDVAIYIFEDDEWTAATNKSAAGLSKSGYNTMYLINSDDDAEYEIIVIIK